MNTNKLYLNQRLNWGIAILGTCLATQAGDVTGKITFKGTPKPEITIDMSADPSCSKLHDKPVTTRHFVVSSDGGFGDVFIYVKEGLSGKTFPAPAENRTLEQKGCFYTPYVLGVQANQPLRIVNADPTLHNVHALPKINKEFNFAQPMQNMVTEKKFEKPEVLVKFKCDVHPWMFAYVGVVDNPFYAVSAPDGTFKIANLPAGKYTIEAVHPKAGVQTQEITVGAGATQANFTFEAKPAAK